MGDTAPTSIERLNAFMERGWMAALSPIELQVWLCYHKHADAAGISWPGTSLVAAFVGHDADAHVRAARCRLVDHGLLIPQPRKRLPSGALQSPFRVVVPEPAAGSKGEKVQQAVAAKRSKVERLPPAEQAGEAFENGTVGEPERSELERSDPPTVPVSRANRSTSDHPTVPLRNTEQTREQTKEQKDPHTPPRCGGAARPRVVQRQPHDPVVLAIYDAYPLKVGKGYGLKAITVALRDLELQRGPTAEGGESWDSWLLARVRLFAEARARSLATDPTDRPRYTPNPATWFNGQHFDDDPAAWERGQKGTKNGHALHKPAPTARTAGQFEQTVRVAAFQRRGGSPAGTAGTDGPGQSPVGHRQPAAAVAGAGACGEP